MARVPNSQFRKPGFDSLLRIYYSEKTKNLIKTNNESVKIVFYFELIKLKRIISPLDCKKDICYCSPFICQFEFFE